MRVADLFSGCGGSSRGAVEAGCEVVCAIDNNPKALATYAHNFPTHGAVRMDVGDVAGVVAHLKPLKVDCVIASPPCQSFSSANLVADSTDARAHLTRRSCEIICALKPRCFVIENSPRLLCSAVWRECAALLQRAGYHVHASVVNFAHFVPQRRRRAIAVGALAPAPVARYVRALGVLKASPELTIAGAFPGTRLFWHYSRDRRSAQIRDARAPYLVVRRNSHYAPKTPAAYAQRKGDVEAWGPDVRVFGVGELAQIQGLGAHTWPLGLSTSARMLQIANAVPPPAMTWVLSQLMPSGACASRQSARRTGASSQRP